MSLSLDALNLEGAKSEALRAAIACIMDATAVDGGPRYSRRVISALTRMIVCRSYAKPTLELSHLIAAISDNKNRFEHVLWGVDRASPTSFRGHIRTAKLIETKAKISVQGITHISGGDEFLISFGRMPVLAALVEFLITIFGYQRVDEITATIRSGSPSMREVSDVANALQRELYAYLKKNLPPAHRQKRERHFLQFVDEQAGNRTGAEAISDDAVLAYWRAFADDTSHDNKTYRSVYEMAVRMVIALDTASERIQGNNAASIGTHREAGEFDLEDVEAVMAAYDPDDTALSRVVENSVDAVKFITATEVEFLSTLPMRSSIERRVPLSIVRNAVQGAHQLKISAALRRDSSVNQAVLLVREGSYQDCLRKYQELSDVLERILAAALWVLFSARHPSAISVALTLAPDINWGALATTAAAENETTVVVSMDIRRTMNQFFDTVPDARGEELQALMAECRQAYRSINRKGFTDPGDPAAVSAMSDGVDDLTALIAAIRRYTEREVGNVEWDDIEREDIPVFRQIFNRLYLRAAGIAAHD